MNSSIQAGCPAARSLEDLQGEAGELDILRRAISAISSRSSSADLLAPAAGEPGDRMDPPPAEDLDDLVVARPAGDHLLADLDPDLADDAEDVALRGGASGPTMKSGPPSA